MTYLLGIDISTTATKALLIDTEGNVVAVATKEYGFDTPHPLWSEQDPALWWHGTITSIREVVAQAGINPAAIRGIGLTGQMHGLVLLDEAGQVLRPSILWNDQRTAAQCDEIRARIGKAKLIEQTGNDALTGFTAPKILWVREHEPQIYARIRHILLPKDFVRYQLTGQPGMDVADGAGTLLIDLRQRNWSTDVLAAFQSWLAAVIRRHRAWASVRCRKGSSP